jgi:outer membrane receptor for Fe3+-dicitrate
MDLITGTFPPVMFRQAPMEQLLIEFPHKRLTGYALLDHNKRGSRYASKAELIKAAGYTRIKANGEEAVAFTDYYTALLEVKQYQAMVDIFNDAHANPSKSSSICNVIDGIRHQLNYSYRTDSVVLTRAVSYRNYNDVDLNVYHQKKLIAAVDYKRKVVVLRISEGSRSDKKRLNRILMHFCGCNLFSRNKVWTIVKPFEDETKVTGYWTEVPFLSTQFPE